MSRGAPRRKLVASHRQRGLGDDESLMAIVGRGELVVDDGGAEIQPPSVFAIAAYRSMRRPPIAIFL